MNEMSTGDVTDDVHSREVPLCVDVDGSVLKTDLLYESLLAYVKRNPLRLISVFSWLRQGKAHLKHELASRVAIDVTALPVHQPVVDFIQNESRRGRRVLLASASNQHYISQLSQHLGLGEDVVASDKVLNLRGPFKAIKLVSLFGEKGFDYLGNDSTDLDVWSHANNALVVSHSTALVEQARKKAPVSKVFLCEHSVVRPFLKGIRVHQWLKNLLIFLPALLGHRIFETHVILQAILAFIAFSLSASAVYVFNDILDLEADRIHARKRRRPWASGTLSIRSGLLAAPLLFFLGSCVGAATSTAFLSILAVYIISTFAYSFLLKQIVLVDIFVLAGLYTLRIIAGGIATEIPVSKWLLGVSMFFFLSLACVKRFSEMDSLLKKNQTKLHGRGYRAEDADQIAMFGAASGYIAALVLALYVSSEEVIVLYRHPKAIWLACPLILYWISRVWLLARRGLVHEDPLVFALKDRVTYIVTGLLAVTFLFAL